MPRFFFNVVNGDFEADKLGAELSDLKAAREEAVRTARELIAEGVSMHGERPDRYDRSVLGGCSAVTPLRFSGIGSAERPENSRHRRA